MQVQKHTQLNKFSYSTFKKLHLNSVMFVCVTD